MQRKTTNEKMRSKEGKQEMLEILGKMGLPIDVQGVLWKSMDWKEMRKVQTSLRYQQKHTQTLQEGLRNMYKLVGIWK